MASYSQVKQNSTLANMVYAKEYSKEIAEHYAKSFAMDNIIGTTNESIRFVVDAVAASSSGQLTTLLYKCDKLDKKGLILGFFGSRWNDAGAVYQAYAFKQMPLDEAKGLLDSISSSIEKQWQFLDQAKGSNNVCFQYGDIRVLIYKSALFTPGIRLFWNGFDSNWEDTGFDETKKRLADFFKAD